MVQKRPKKRPFALRTVMDGRLFLAFTPIVVLLAFRMGGEVLMVAVAVALPLAVLVARTFHEHVELVEQADQATGLMLRDALIDWADRSISKAAELDLQVAVIVATIDGLDQIEERFGESMRDTVLREAMARLNGLLREGDAMARIGDGFAIGIANLRAPETENLMLLASRLQSVFEEPISEGPTRTYCTLSLGLAAEAHVQGASGANLVAAAQRAGELAQVSNAGAVRVYSEGLSSQSALDRDIAAELVNALETGEIFAWFQPQVRTRDGRVIGFEALARWDHPDRGLIAPTSFLPDIEKAGLSQRLAEVILKQALMAINTWEAAGYDVPAISVNFSSEELRNPKLADYVRWELDRHGIAPERLVVEVLESVASESNEDAISRTLMALSRMGCRIDIDDFGTGFTSFVNVRRFKVERIKIDRSLVSNLDTDEDQHRMLSALLAFARNLGIEALAEGVETEGEVSALRALDCRDIQGYFIARPMPLGETLLWLEDRAESGDGARDAEGLAAG